MGIGKVFLYFIFKTFIPAQLASEYLAGAILLGAAPCTAMMIVWSLFSLQVETILNNPTHILLITVSLFLQMVLIFFVAYGWAEGWKLPYDVAAPAGMIGASNFFELAVAVASSLFGLQSGVSLATVVELLVEVLIVLMLVRIANNTREWFLT